MLPAYVILDLETTGATPLRDRITEIALIRYEGGIEVARWETLVNPEQPIPPFIQQLTGIDNDMVATAPLFREVADTLLTYLEGAVLCAHNVRFDHGFLKAEYKRLGMTLRQRVLCTVKISRLLYLGFPSHGLDAIMRRHGITTIARHRAMGDVETVAAFLQIAENELGAARVKERLPSSCKRQHCPRILMLPSSRICPKALVFTYFSARIVCRFISVKALIFVHGF